MTTIPPDDQPSQHPATTWIAHHRTLVLIGVLLYTPVGLATADALGVPPDTPTLVLVLLLCSIMTVLVLIRITRQHADTVCDDCIDQLLLPDRPDLVAQQHHRAFYRLHRFSELIACGYDRASKFLSSIVRRPIDLMLYPWTFTIAEAAVFVPLVTATLLISPDQWDGYAVTLPVITTVLLLVHLNRVVSVHNKLIPWCPWCQHGDGGDDDTTPVAPPPPNMTKTT